MDGTKLKGFYGTDRVCPTTDTGSCANDFKFVAISEASGLQSYEDGVVGMWSGNTDDGSYDKTKMFVLEMVADSTITDKIFSWYMSDEQGKTYIDFGAPNSSVFDASNLVYLPIKNNNYKWASTITGFRWTTNSNNNEEYKFTEAEAFTDTGSACIMGPYKDIFYFRNTILNMIPYVISHDGWSY